jgi:Uncharacterized protein involved in copper resistance
MVRPRVGDFCYSPHEVQVMLEDISIFKDLGVRGCVVGALTDDGRVDVDTMKQYVVLLCPIKRMPID